MSQDRNENKRRLLLLKNAGYSVNIDGSWGPYLNKLWMHYLSSGLGPTKQLRVDAAKKANQKEALTAKHYFSQAPSIGNIAKGVYHWFNSVSGLGGLNESGVLEYNVADNPVAASTTGPGSSVKLIIRTRLMVNDYIKGFINKYPTSGSLFGNIVNQTSLYVPNWIKIDQIKNLPDLLPWRRMNPNYVIVNLAKPKNLPILYNEPKVKEALKIAEEIPTVEAKLIESPPKSSENPSPWINLTDNVATENTTRVLNTSKKGIDWNYWLGFGSFGSPAPNTKKVGTWALNIGKGIIPFWAITLTGAYFHDNSVLNARRARAKALGKEYIEVPTPLWSASPIGWFLNMHRADVEKGDLYFKETSKPKATTLQEMQDYFWKLYENY